MRSSERRSHVCEDQRGKGVARSHGNHREVAGANGEDLALLRRDVHVGRTCACSLVRGIEQRMPGIGPAIRLPGSCEHTLGPDDRAFASFRGGASESCQRLGWSPGLGTFGSLGRERVRHRLTK